MNDEKVNILLVDDQPQKLITYEAILRDLGENLITARGARPALEQLLKIDVAVILIDVNMPEIDGFELAKMIRDHPRFQKTAIIFISAVILNDVDRLRGYDMGAVDYVSVPVVPEVLLAKVRIFVELYRKNRQLERLNTELEARVAERTAELRASTLQLQQSEQLRSLALVTGQMGTWEWDLYRGTCVWDEGQSAIFGLGSDDFAPTARNIRRLVHPDDMDRVQKAFKQIRKNAETLQIEFRVRQPGGGVRWCFGAVAASFNEANKLARLSGVTIDITDRKLAEERQMLLAEEVDHRARNVVTVVQSMMRLTQSDDIDNYKTTLDGRISALSNAHTLLSRSRWQGADLSKLVNEEFEPYRLLDPARIFADGPPVILKPSTAQTIALAVHELTTNAAKYGALSTDEGRVRLSWSLCNGNIELAWIEQGGPAVTQPTHKGYGTKVISSGIEHQLGGNADFDWRPDGLCCTLSIPYKEKTKHDAGERKNADSNPQSLAKQIETGNLVLLVEDEPLIAMMLANMLTDLGFKVDGPYSRLDEAIDAAKTRDIHAGILDINLAGELAYPLAEVLVMRGIPFVFVSGYNFESVDRRFAQIPILQKPIERQKLQALLSSVH